MPENNGKVAQVSVVMPCLNEARTVGSCVREALDAFESAGLQVEVIVVDNGSNDDSVTIASEAGARVVRAAERGYGSALLAGISAAQAEIVVMGDADCSYSFLEAPTLVQRLIGDYDLVLGNRFPRYGGNILPGAMPWLNRYIGNPVLSGLGNLFFRTGVHDFHCGLRAFKRQAILDLGLRCGGMEFATEMVLKAKLGGLRIGEMPITLRPDGRARRSHLRPWRDGWRHLRFMLLYAPSWVFLAPGALMMLFGVGLSLRLIWGPIVAFGIGLDVHTLMIATLVSLIGFQSIIFGLGFRALALNFGLFGKSVNNARWPRALSLEVGLIASALMILIGVGLLLIAVWQWHQASWGALDPSFVIRLVAPAVWCLAIGTEGIFASFFLSALGLLDSDLRK